MSPIVKSFFDELASTVSYVVSEPAGKHCAIIYSVLDFDASSGRIRTDSADEIVQYVLQQHLINDWLLETHAHADHLSAASYIQKELGGKMAIGEHIQEVQAVFEKLFNLKRDFHTDGSQFDHLLKDADEFQIGEMTVTTFRTPGHTPACMTYLIGDTAFVGDTLFMPDYGTARADFTGGDAHQLYQSIQKLFCLPDDTRVFLCRDYKAPGRDEYQRRTKFVNQVFIDDRPAAVDERIRQGD